MGNRDVSGLYIGLEQFFKRVCVRLDFRRLLRWHL